jgi:hypothetical protein
MITVAAPASLLLASGLSPKAKVIWLASHLVSPLTVANLQTATGGISATSIRRGLSELSAAGWPAAGSAPSAATPAISLPADLLVNRRVGAMAKVLFGMLHLTPGFDGRQTALTYHDLGQLAGACSITMQIAATELRQAGWLKITRARRSCVNCCRSWWSQPSSQTKTPPGLW